MNEAIHPLHLAWSRCVSAEGPGQTFSPFLHPPIRHTPPILVMLRFVFWNMWCLSSGPGSYWAGRAWWWGRGVDSPTPFKDKLIIETCLRDNL